MNKDKGIEHLMTGGVKHKADPNEKKYPAWVAYLILIVGCLSLLFLALLYASL